MELKTEKFVRRPFHVQAVQITADNMAEVAKWCGGTIKSEGAVSFIKVDVQHPVNVRQTQGYVGNWVLKAGEQFKVYQDKAFKATFQQDKTKVERGYTVTNA